MSENNGPVSGLLQYVFETEAQRRRFAESATGPIEGDIPLDRTFGGKVLSITSLDRSNYTHGFHKYPAKYIPEIPRWAIRKFTATKDSILDPFSGSGTTSVEARLQGRDSYALDIDPLARLLTKVKTTPLDETKLRVQKDRLFLEMAIAKDAVIPEFPNRDYWFREDVLRDLGVVYGAILKVTDPDIRDFFLVCLSSILKEVSNADPKFLYALAISTQMRAKGRRTIDAKKMFIERVAELVPKMNSFSKACQPNNFAKIIGNNARKIPLQDEQVALTVTSPPYLNAVDYPRAHQLQLYWFGFWKGPLAELKKEYIGNEQVPAASYSKRPTYGSRFLDSIIEKLFEVDKRRAQVIYQYFVDMRETLFEIRRVLKNGGYFCYAVADNLVRKVQVPTHEILAQIAEEEVGFTPVDSFASVLMMRPHNMRESEKMSAEWVMIFRK